MCIIYTIYTINEYLYVLKTIKMYVIYGLSYIFSFFILFWKAVLLYAYARDSVLSMLVNESICFV